MVDTNCDPDPIDHVIPSNDDAIRAIKLITSKFADAALEGLSLRQEMIDEEIQDIDGYSNEFEDLDDRFSYAYGIDLAHKFEAEGIELNVALLAEAMDDVFSDGNKRMSSGEVAATMEIYRELFLKKKEKLLELLPVW